MTTKFRIRSFSFIYGLVSNAVGIGDEAIRFQSDEKVMFLTANTLVSIFYILGLCHLSGYVSAYYSIKTGNRVQTTSWLQVHFDTTLHFEVLGRVEVTDFSTCRQN